MGIRLVILLQCSKISGFFNEIIGILIIFVMLIIPIMKYRLYLYAYLFLFFVVSCTPDRAYRIGVSQCSDDDWRTRMNDEINREIMFHPEATVEIRSADDSNEKQIADLQYFLDNHFDIIVVAPNEADAITPTIKKIYDAGVPVVVFDRKINGESYTVFQGVDNVEIGHRAAVYAADKLGRGGRVIEIYGLLGSTPALERHQGFVGAADSLGLKVVASAHGDWTYEGASRSVDSLLDIYKDIDLIYAHNDRMAIAAADVTRARGRDIKIIGIDAAPEIGMRAVADSVIDASFIYPTEGYRLVRTALDILEKREYERTVALPLAPVVDSSNASMLLVQNDALKEETDKISLLKKQLDEYWSRHSAQTSLFYATIAILLLLVVILVLLARVYLTHRRHQAILEQQNQRLEEKRDELAMLNTRLREATQSKVAFFTNVSHDLRTPLTLIADPVQELENASNLDARQRSLVKIAAKNLRILRRLVNQILDFEKNEDGKLDLVLSECPVSHLVMEWIESFQGVVRHRELHLSYNIDVPVDFTMALDVEKIERVFFNLLSNAIKYTPANGHIAVDVSVTRGSLILKVSDTGRGISGEDMENIFDRFFQAERIHPKGSGIGLSLAKAFVELHGGQIEVESSPGEGSVFTVSIPVGHVEESPDGRSPGSTITQEDINNELGIVDISQADIDTSKPLMLVIDDNVDMRTLIAQLVGDKYSVIPARDGQEGLRLAARYVPDIIICDVMMPVMDGFECCKALKAETSTSHIPVLLLTACAMDSQRVQGYESGADGYLSKPFDKDVLLARCSNLIDNRRLIKNLWGGNSIALSPVSRPVVTPSGTIDDEFYDKALAVMKSKLKDPEVSVDDMAGELGLGRSQFYRKIKALTNYSPVELMRNLRLKMARDLLAGTSRTISEIAYETGFSTPAYFTRCFREAYGETPSELREKLGVK